MIIAEKRRLDMHARRPKRRGEAGDKRKAHGVGRTKAEKEGEGGKEAQDDYGPQRGGWRVS